METPVSMTDEDRQAIIAAVTAAINQEQAPPKALYKALAAANLAFPGIFGEGLDSILSAVRKPLADNGLALVQRIVAKDPAGEFVETTLVHDSGESISNLTKMVADQEDQIGYSKAQGLASRDGILLLLCLATSTIYIAERPNGDKEIKPGDIHPKRKP